MTTIVRSDAAQHGSRRMRQLGCDCFPCRIADARYKHAWREGHRARVDVRVVIGHLNRLTRSGWTDRDINAAAGFGTSTLWHIRSGRQRTVNSRTARAIFALTPRDPAPGWLIRLAAAAGRLHGTTATAILSRSIRPACVDARYQLMRLLRDAGWSCRAVGHVMHRTEWTVTHSTAHLKLDVELEQLLDEVPDPTGETPALDVCEDCDGEPMGGGRWCYPHYLEHRRAA